VEWLLWLAWTLGAQAKPGAEDVVAKASAYVQRYETQLGGVVAEEDYIQEVASIRGQIQKRRLTSDFLLVRFSENDPWTPFRDVIAVDGKPVQDRQDRLERLFLARDAATARSDLRRIADESARYNLGPVYRTINVPFLALTFLRPENISRFHAQAPRSETLDGVAVWRIDYSERARPTLIRGREGEYVPARGAFWIRQEDGAVLQTRVRAEVDRVGADILVKYCQPAGLSMLVPCTMREKYDAGAQQINATATYSNIRQFTVTTNETIKR